MQQDIEAIVTVIAIVPDWLSEPLSVLLETSKEVRLAGSASSLEELAPPEEGPAPDLVLVYADGRDDVAVEQIRQLKACWPDAHLITLVDRGGQRELAEAAGASQVMMKGVSPGRLMQSIQDAQAASRAPDTPNRAAGRDGK